ncbi:innexin inx2-like [Oratosquilla oratoria]|uniref:innexin inx2-like n=1 Tax=Oratosquilla oratoria TaxID=337810 RepID=UPI003F76105A
MNKAFSQLNLKVSLTPKVDNLVFRLHYKYTYRIFMASVILSTIYDVVGDKIKCMVDNYGDVVSSYCFIMGTFTVQRHHSPSADPNLVAYPGVGPANVDDEIITHGYYQWVPFVLFGTGVLFFVPHWLWKAWEGGVLKTIIQDLSIRDYLKNDLANYMARSSRFEALSKYILHQMDNHRLWAYKFVFCEVLNLVVVVLVMLATDSFLGGEFMTYGISVFEVLNQEPEDRTDPMTYVFPRWAKCTFRLFGPSGGVQVKDAMCLIATNIINEKIYLFLWVWLVFLMSVTSVWLLYRLATIVIAPVRFYVLKSKGYKASDSTIKQLLRQFRFSEWFLLCHLGKNMETSVFSEFLDHLVSELGSSTDTLPLGKYVTKDSKA